MEKRYLGDGAYVEVGCYPGEIIITTSDGIRTTNTIYLGPNEIVALGQFVEAVAEEIHADNQDEKRP